MGNYNDPPKDRESLLKDLAYYHSGYKTDPSDMYSDGEFGNDQVVANIHRELSQLSDDVLWRIWNKGNDTP